MSYWGCCGAVFLQREVTWFNYNVVIISNYKKGQAVIGLPFFVSDALISEINRLDNPSAIKACCTNAH